MFRFRLGLLGLVGFGAVVGAATMAMKPPAADGVESQSARDADAIALKPDVPNVAADQIVDVLNVKQRMSATSSNIDLSSVSVDGQSDVKRVFSFYVGLVGDDTALSSETAQSCTVLGIHAASAGPVLRSHLQIEGEFGLIVTHVQEESAAAIAKLQKFDVLMEFDGQHLVNQDQFTTLVRSRRPGDEVPLQLYRRGQLLLVQVTLRSGPAHDPQEDVLNQDATDNLNPQSHFLDYRFRQCGDCHDDSNATNPMGGPSAWGEI